jgi:hypothetical protein
MLSIYHAGLHYQSLPINPASGKLQSALKPASIPSLLELSRGITAVGNITTCMHAGLSEVHLTFSRQRRRGKYLLTKFVREGTYTYVVKRKMPKGLDITDLEYYTLPPVRISKRPCVNSRYSHRPCACIIKHTILGRP